MPATNITPVRAANKFRRITSNIAVLADGGAVEDGTLSPVERVQVSHAIARQAAGILAEGGKVGLGHRIAVMAHVVHLMQEEGEDSALMLAGLVAGMLGARIERDTLG